MANAEIIEQLKKQILHLQGNKCAMDQEPVGLGLGAMEGAFPGKVFPRGVTHEFISSSFENATCTNAFISVVLAKLLQGNRTCVWVTNQRKIFPPALKIFGVDPESVLFIEVKNTKEALWTIEEALKCGALAGVVGEISELSFNESRRLQLAVEQSQVTGLIHRHNPKTTNTVACVSRWAVSSVASVPYGKLPGVGYPRWKVQLLKVRGGTPAEWVVEWSPKGIQYLSQEAATPLQVLHRKTG